MPVNWLSSVLVTHVRRGGSDFHGAFKYITSSFVSLMEEHFSEHQNSVAQNILLSNINSDVMRSRSTTVILLVDERF